MTPDELVTLCQALVGDLTLAQARKGLGVAKNLDDGEFILLMRFMSGERPTYNVMALENPTATKVITGAPSASTPLDDDDDEPSGPVDFDGVTLY